MLVPINGVLLDVDDSGGDGQAVLLIHGFPDTGALWNSQKAALSRAGFRPITVDLRGFGLSSKPTHTADYAPQKILGDITGVLDHVGLSRAHVVGHDWGAVIAWVFAGAHPERVITLSCLSTGHPASYRNAGWAQREKGWYTLLFQFDIARQWLLKDSAANLRQFLMTHPQADEVLARLTDEDAAESALGLYRAWAPPESMVAQPSPPTRIAAPTLGVWGTEDAFLVEGQMTGSSAFVDAGWRYERVEGAGHWLPLDAPDQVSGLLIEHLRGTVG